jgi:para-aminobenzoate N-oxygenase AurF
MFKIIFREVSRIRKVFIMAMRDRYTSPVPGGTWDIPTSGATRFNWEYDDGRDRLLSLYQKGKDMQWDVQKRVDWDLPVDVNNAAGMPDEVNPLVGSDVWERMSEEAREEFRRHQGSWVFSLFLHGEQGALNVAARIVESIPDLDSKFYAATQVMDEARHIELFAKFVEDKIGMYYPINQDLAKMFEGTLSDSRWDYLYLGMQVLLEGLGLATFSIYRDMTTNPLVKQLLAYVMQDEARHVAFGRIALKEYYAELSSKERDEREEFVVEGCYLMRDRFKGKELYETLGMPVKECMSYIESSPIYGAFQTQLFSRIVPCVRDIGLWGDKVQKAYADMGVLDAAQGDLVQMMKRDEDIAEEIDRAKHEQELAVRRDEVHAAIADGAAD